MTSLPPRRRAPGEAAPAPAAPAAPAPATTASDDDDADNDPLLGGQQRARAGKTGVGGRQRRPYNIISRRNFGLLLLGVVVFAWVSSNFLTHAIFADDSYSKPYFITYLNTSTFCLYLLPTARRKCRSLLVARRRGAKDGAATDSSGDDADLLPDDGDDGPVAAATTDGGATRLTTRETMRFSATFCLVWFFANYFNAYCLKFTTVSSATILSSTAAMFTLMLGSLFGVETFTLRKMVAVLLSAAGTYLVATNDLNAPLSSSTAAAWEAAMRTPLQIAVGDGMALLSALSYASYTTLLKVRVGDESRVDMQQFFGFVGLFNTVFLWPGLLLLHATGIEPWEMPNDGRVWAIVLVNAAITLTSDLCWAYATLLTSPVVVTVGLSLTIPLAMLGQMLFEGAVGAGGWGYWVGAACVFTAFWVLSRQE